MGSNSMPNKICSQCREAKPVSEFHRRGVYVSPRGSVSIQFSPLCKPCRAGNRKGKEAHYSRKQKYGITKEQYEQLLVDQNYLCAACGDELGGSAHMDHNHETGEFRGILCRSCNLALGIAKDNAQILRKIADYRERYE